MIEKSISPTILCNIMTDVFTKDERSLLMSKVRVANTEPELILRKGLHRLGFRYTLHDKRLPGRPDMVFPKYRSAVFVHGCFWHCHTNCSKASIPKTNTEFWSKKLQENVHRDKRHMNHLIEQGWNVVVVWECEILKDAAASVAKVADALKGKDSQVQSGKVRRRGVDASE